MRRVLGVILMLSPAVALVATGAGTPCSDEQSLKARVDGTCGASVDVTFKSDLHCAIKVDNWEAAGLPPTGMRSRNLNSDTSLSLTSGFSLSDLGSDGGVYHLCSVAPTDAGLAFLCHPRCEPGPGQASNPACQDCNGTLTPR